MSGGVAEVDIASDALMHLGRDGLATFQDSERAAAKALQSRYPRVRDKLLRTYPWNFAMTVRSLPGEELAKAEFGMTHRCILPSGGANPHCLRVWRVRLGAGAADNPTRLYAGAELPRHRRAFAVRGRHLYVAQTPPIDVQYIARVEDPNLFDELFRELVAIDLALASINLLATDEIRKATRELKAERRQIVRQARLSDALEGAGDQFAQGEQGSWLDARRPL